MFKTKFGVFLGSVALAGLLVGAQPAAAGTLSAELETVLASAQPGQELSVIVNFVDTSNVRSFRAFKRKIRRSTIVRALRQQAEESQAEVRDFVTFRGGRKLRQLWIQNSLAMIAPAELIEEIATLKGVESIRLDAVVNAPDPVQTAAVTTEANITGINAPLVWAQGHTGAGVVVANLDTGVDYQHDDLAGNWRAGTNSWYDPHNQHAAPADSAGTGTGHGTGTMSLMVGGSATGSSIGVAPGATWIAAKIFDDAGSATLSSIHAAFQWILDPDGNWQTDDAPQVVNNSWSLTNVEGQCITEFVPDINLIRAAGIAMVFAAGNSGPNGNTSLSPANNPGAISVGAVDHNAANAIASFSSRGPNPCDPTRVFPDIVAPGVSVKMADVTFSLPGGPSFTDTWVQGSGTSFAAPHVAGVMALLLGAYPDTRLDVLETVLSNSAADLGTPGADSDYGNGLVDADAAYTQLAALAATDTDGDGVGSHADCNDGNASIFPGATDTRRDGIDQDCNGYDMTIKTTRKVYRPSLDKVVMTATSSLNGGAALEVQLENADGSQVLNVPMSWKPNKGRWQWIRKNFSTTYGFVPTHQVVHGIEGVTRRTALSVK